MCRRVDVRAGFHLSTVATTKPPCRPACPPNGGTHARRLRVGVRNLWVIAAVEGANAVLVAGAVIHRQGGIEAVAARPGDDNAVGGGGVLVELQ